MIVSLLRALVAPVWRGVAAVEDIRAGIWHIARRLDAFADALSGLAAPCPGHRIMPDGKREPCAMLLLPGERCPICKRGHPFAGLAREVSP